MRGKRRSTSFGAATSLPPDFTPKRLGRGARSVCTPGFASAYSTVVAGLAIAGGGALLERDRELGVIDGLVQDTLDGRPAVALVEGPAGIGKTRLLGEAREKASAAGFRVLAARGSDLERELPFGVVRQLFEPAEEGQAAGDVSFGILYGLFWLTANIAAEEEPLLLAIDDLHWCDRASL